MKQALPAGAAPRRGLSPQQRRLLVIVLGSLLIIIAVQMFRTHENDYEKIAHQVTVGLQNNDLKTVEKYENAETATQVNRQRVGRAADALAPLGKLRKVKETGGEDRTHQFELTFEKGTLQEKIKFDPDKKIVLFHYDAPVLK